MFQMMKEFIHMRSFYGVGLRLATALSATVLFCTTGHTAPPARNIAEKSLSKVCAVAVPASVERATAYYLLPITAMGGDAKPLCRLWPEVNPADENSMMLWDGVAGAVLLHAVEQQSNIAPYRALIGKAIVIDPALFNRWLKTVDLAMEGAYVHVSEKALLSRNWTTLQLADHLRSRAPEVAVTLQKGYDKWNSGK